MKKRCICSLLILLFMYSITVNSNIKVQATEPTVLLNDESENILLNSYKEANINILNSTDGTPYYVYNDIVYSISDKAYIGNDGLIYNASGHSGENQSILYGKPNELIIYEKTHPISDELKSNILEAVDLYKQQFNEFFLGNDTRILPDSVMDDTMYSYCVDDWTTYIGIPDVTIAVGGVTRINSPIEVYYDISWSNPDEMRWYVNVAFIDDISGNQAYIEFPLYEDGSLAPLEYIFE